MTRHRISSALFLAVLSLTILGCDLLGSEENSEIVTSGVYVANAGGLGNANSSVTIFDPSTQQTQHLEGDNFTSYIQSLTIAPDRFYVLFGETNSVGVFDIETNDPIGQISGIQNPRYMAVIENMGYVTGQDYSASPSPKLYQIDRSSNEVIDSVDVGGSPEDVVARNTRVYVALGGQDGAVAVVDPAAMSVTDTIPVECDAPRSLAFDRQNELLVFCAGAEIYDENFEVVDRTDGAIRVVNPTTTEITSRIPLDTMLTSASQGQRVHYAPETDEAFAVQADQSIIRFDAAANQITNKFSASGAPIGAIAYDSGSERLYIGRADEANPFSAGGTVTVHQRNGTETNSFVAGVAPTYIDFRRAEE